MNLASMWGVRLTLAAVLAHWYGLQGVWTAMAVELTFRGMLFLARLKWGAWLKGERGAEDDKTDGAERALS